ncbi:MAG: aspartate/glutamate racemase family protein [Chloroflexota bacterium]|jgi:aspartate racemase|nr:aspartate/glutamate racemase family protein [Chloroflexota bacterium]
MKTIGLIGGMSWESSIEYYRIINQTVSERLGGVHSAKSLMYSFDFAAIEALQREGNWDQMTQEMINAAQTLEQGGADLLLICTNTMHRMAEEVQAAMNIPLLHIADAAAQAIKAQNIHTIGLLGTRFTMEGNFYRLRLQEKHGLKVLIPSETDRETVHRVIYDELVKGQLRDSSRETFIKIIESLKAQGAQGVILGCTEIPLLVKSSNVDIPLFDTMTIHAQAAVDITLDN